MTSMNLVRLGLSIRALRRRLGWRQLDLARRARVSQQTISRIERGRTGSASLDATARVVEALEADLDLVVRWRGGALERVLDERHATLSGIAANRLADAGWAMYPEVSYAVYGERGSIDLLGIDDVTRILLVVEVKTELLSIEATLRKHDEKCRLAPRIAQARLAIGPGWRAAAVLVLPDTGASRRRVAAHAAVLDRVYPLRGRVAAGWLRDPARRPAAGPCCSFLLRILGVVVVRHRPPIASD
jgi:transcriptional regulator with XRE-family HTH domain